ncbi:hypothetical protein Tco_1222904, partial [Tanacetum coccineum]
MTHPSPKRNLVSLSTARPVNTAQPRSTVNSARPMPNGVNTVKDKNVNTARPKAVVNTAKPKAVLNAVKRNQVNAVKASAWNMSYHIEFEEIDGEYVAFR